MKDYKIVGTFSLMDIDENFGANFIKSSSIYLYRIAILPEYQGKSIGKEIINHACKYSENVNKSLYLDCFAGNEKLRSFYLKSGFDYCGDFPEEDYSISVFKYYK
jgi:RimJ/RimL family protein N-acetyltransferase